MSSVFINSDFTLNQSHNESVLLIDASNSDINLYLPYSIDIDVVCIKRTDDELNNVNIIPKSSELVEK